MFDAGINQMCFIHLMNSNKNQIRDEKMKVSSIIFN